MDEILPDKVIRLCGELTQAISDTVDDGWRVDIDLRNKPMSAFCSEPYTIVSAKVYGRVAGFGTKGSE